MKRALLLLFAGLFAFATAQTASAQESESSHTVNVTVQEFTSINVTGTPSITVDELNTWKSGDGAASYTVTTNDGSSKKVTAQVTSGPDEFGQSISLRVSSMGDPGNASFSGDVELSDESATDLIGGFSNVNTSSLDLSYEAKATAGFSVGDNSESVDLTVKYTLTGDGS